MRRPWSAPIALTALAALAMLALASPARGDRIPLVRAIWRRGRRRSKLRLRQPRAMHGYDPRNGRFLRTQLVLQRRRRAARQAGAQTPERLMPIERFARERMTGRYPMRRSYLVLFALAALAALDLFTPSAGQAEPYPWCAQYGSGRGGGGRNCGFVSWEQCMATVRGIGRILRTELVLYRPRRAARQARAQASRRLIRGKASLHFTRRAAPDGAACALA